MDDLISRQAAINICRKTKWNGADDYLPMSARNIESEIRALPSAQPTQTNASNTLNALDCVSRVQALNNIKSLYPEAPRINFMDNLAQWKKKYSQYMECERAIESLPPIHPEQKQGEWKRSLGDLESGSIRCSCCDTEFDYYLVNQLAMESCETEFPKFCPNCGAKMSNLKVNHEN